MKHNEDIHRRNITSIEGDEVFLKLQPYHQKSLSCHYNEKLALGFYGPYKVQKKIGNAAYQLALPPDSRIHPIFHVSQLKRAIGSHQPSVLPSHITESLELKPTPAALLDLRYQKDGILEALIYGLIYLLQKQLGRKLYSLLNSFHTSTLRTRCVFTPGYCYALH